MILTSTLSNFSTRMKPTRLWLTALTAIAQIGFSQPAHGATTVATPLAGALAAPAAPTAVCIDFEDLTVGTTYPAGTALVTSGHNVEVYPFVPLVGAPVSGTLSIDNAHKSQSAAGGAGQDAQLNNVIFKTSYSPTVSSLSIVFGEFGGSIDLAINGDFTKTNNFFDVGGKILGGVNVGVFDAGDGTHGRIDLTGVITTIAIGGQELWIDSLCPPQQPPPQEARTDLGDAPDSSNHHGITTTAYLGPIAGHFPTVWGNTPAGAGTGPKHADIKKVWLGAAVSPEAEADVGPDADGNLNILDGVADNSNNDRTDDGWLNRNASFENCRETKLLVRVSKNVTATVNQAYLNVWFDGNRDGDWEDQAQCEQVPGQTVTPIANEWIVRDMVINTAIISGAQDIVVPTVLVMNSTLGQQHWLRFTLSDRPAVAVAGKPADGRGPDFPGQFELGETEDYLQAPTNQQEKPGQLVITKTVAAPVTTTVFAGQVFTYRIELSHFGGSTFAMTTLTDPLPIDLIPAGAPVVTALIPTAGPLFATIVSNTLQWSGSLAPNSRLGIALPVRVRPCLGQDHPLINTAFARNTDGNIISSTASLLVHCPPPPSIEIHKGVSVSTTNGSPIVLTETEALPETPLLFTFSAKNNSDSAARVRIVDTLPPGMNVADDTEDSGAQSNLIQNSTTNSVSFDDMLEPGQTITRSFIARLVGPCVPDEIITNTADVEVYPSINTHDSGGSRSITGEDENGDGIKTQTNSVRVRRLCHDLGDAPDSSNHSGVAMLAYPGVTATFPTVFDPATGLPQGPLHLRPFPYHLGQKVSPEVEADAGSDADGSNNINTPTQADRDRADDGLVPAKLSFKDCDRAIIPVQIFIDPSAAAFFSATQGIGHLNIWLDSNRDGDWADAIDCPSTVAVAGGLATEHIVIDHIINVNALGPGLHTINVPTRLISWPADKANRPAWLRATLSERPSNKPFTVDGVNFGDGRGFNLPFVVGETEDYLWRPVDQQTPDMVIHKRGEFGLDDAGNPFIGWVIDFENVGSGMAHNVVITDNAALAGSDGVAIVSPPIMFGGGSGPVYTFQAFDVAPGSGGHIVLKTRPISGTTVYTNSVVIVPENGDAHTADNIAIAVVNDKLRAPIVVEPVDGTTCDPNIDIKGVANPGATVMVYLDGALLDTVVANGVGRWQASATGLIDGVHSIYAIAELGGHTSEPSPTRMVIVNSSLTWSPLSLRFVDSRGHMERPVDGSGRTDESGWRVRLLAGESYTVSVRICCEAASASVMGVISASTGITTIVLSDIDGDKVYEGSFTMGGVRGEVGGFTLIIDCGGNTITVNTPVLIDPDGVVYDITNGTLLSGALVMCMQKDSAAGTYSAWPAADFGQINPQTTASDGYFSFFTPVGTFRLDVSRSGYQSYRSPDLEVIAEPVHHNVPLTPIYTDTVAQVVNLISNGFSPSALTVEPGSVIEFVQLGGSDVLTGTQAVASNRPEVASSYDSGALSLGQSYKVKLSQPGVYTFSGDGEPMSIVVSSTQAQSSLTLFMPLMSR